MGVVSTLVNTFSKLVNFDAPPEVAVLVVIIGLTFGTVISPQFDFWLKVL